MKNSDSKPDSLKPSPDGISFPEGRDFLRGSHLVNEFFRLIVNKSNGWKDSPKDDSPFPHTPGFLRLEIVCFAELDGKEWRSGDRQRYLKGCNGEFMVRPEYLNPARIESITPTEFPGLLEINLVGSEGRDDYFGCKYATDESWAEAAGVLRDGEDSQIIMEIMKCLSNS